MNSVIISDLLRKWFVHNLATTISSVMYRNNNY